MDDNAVQERLEMLRRVWPEECELIGEDTLLGLVSEPSELALPDGGAHFDLTPLLQLLSASLEVFVSITTIVRMLREKSMESIHEVDVVLRFEEKAMALPSEISRLKLSEMIEIVIKSKS